MAKYKESCPACGAIWTQEEIEDQSCGACGYPEQAEIFGSEYLEFINEDEIENYE